MQLNVKHFIALGLGVGLTAAACLQIGFNQEEMGRAARDEDLHALSSLDATDDQTPTADFVDSSRFAKLKQSSDPAPLVGQELLENDFVPPETATDSEALTAFSPATPQNDVNSQSDPETEHSLDSQSTDIAFSEQADPISPVDPEPPLTQSVADKNPLDPEHNAIPLSWKRNPYFGDGTNVRATYNSTQSVKSLQDQPLQNQPSEGIGGVEDQTDDLDGPSDDVADSQLEPITILEINPAPAPQQDLLVRQENEITAQPNRGLTPTAAQQAVQHIEYGKSLARRGAAFAARQEFFLALNIIAQSKDENSESSEFSRALTSGFLALKETEGFVMDNIEAGTTLDIASVVAAHRSTVLTKDEAKQLSPAQATQRYFEFAQEQLDHACGRNVVSAEAFFCLGKLYAAMSSKHSVPSNLDASKSIVFHKASLQCDERNFRSANELGVLMAQTGRLEAATEYFKQSLILNRTPQAWMNLAKTHRRLGEREFAELAEAEFVLAAQAPLVNADSPTTSIQWMPTNKFNSLAPDHNHQQVAAQPAKLPKNKTAQDKLKSLSKSFSERLKDLF